jgi:ferrous iron transport protein B
VLTIPCSAQLGLITALLSSRSFSLWLSYVGCLMVVFFVVGYTAAKVLPGRNATFHMELVPMRMPRIGNVLRKTWHRLYWYFREVVPLFVYASVVLWALDLRSGTLFGFVDSEQMQPANALTWIRTGMEPLMVLLDQPKEAAESFLIGFFRRDFGAAGLFKLSDVDAPGAAVALLSDRQILVGSFTMTLFVPCIATFMMMWNERGRRVALTTFALVTGIAFASGALLNQVLVALSWQ